MGAIRYGYSAKCKFFADDRIGDEPINFGLALGMGINSAPHDPESLPVGLSLGFQFALPILPPNRINWYFVPNDRPRFNGWYVFHPRVDERPARSDFLYEQEAPTNHIRTRTDGFDTWGRPGLHVDGDADDFLGLSHADKYSVDGMPPTEPCGGRERIRTMMRLGFKVGQRSPHETIKLGIDAGFTVSRPVSIARLGMAPGFTVTPPGVEAGLIQLNVGLGFTGIGGATLRLGLHAGFTVRRHVSTVKLGIRPGFTVTRPLSTIEKIKLVVGLGFTPGFGVGLGVGLTIIEGEKIGLGLSIGFNAGIDVGLALGITIIEGETIRFGLGIGFTPGFGLGIALGFEEREAANEIVPVGLDIGFKLNAASASLVQLGFAVGFTDGLPFGLSLGFSARAEQIKAGLCLGFAAVDSLDDGDDILPLGMALGYTLADGGGGGGGGEQIYDTPGLFTFTVPPGVTSIHIQVWAFGGDGDTVGAGGGGGYCECDAAVSPGEIWTADLHAYFPSGVNSNSFYAGIGHGVFCTLGLPSFGGAFGQGGSGAASGPGISSVVVHNGGDGVEANPGGGGGSGSPTVDGGNGAGNIGGSAGAGGGKGGNDGANGHAPGGGGGRNGTGANGKVRITW